METLRAQQLIVMVALFVSLVGTLLLLEKINEHGKPVTTASAVVQIGLPKEQSDQVAPAEAESVVIVRVLGNNETEET